jgi:hypothetical protein
VSYKPREWGGLGLREAAAPKTKIKSVFALRACPGLYMGCYTFIVGTFRLSCFNIEIGVQNSTGIFDFSRFELEFTLITSPLLHSL